MLLLIWSLFWTENTEQGRNTHSLDVTPYQLVSAHFDFASHGSVHGNTKQSGIPAEKNTSVWPARGSQNIRQSIQTGRPSLPAGKCFWITTFNANVTSKAKRKSQPFVAHFNQVIGKLNTLVAGKKKQKKTKRSTSLIRMRFGNWLPIRTSRIFQGRHARRLTLFVQAENVSDWQLVGLSWIVRQGFQFASCAHALSRD